MCEASFGLWAAGAELGGCSPTQLLASEREVNGNHGVSSTCLTSVILSASARWVIRGAAFWLFPALLCCRGGGFIFAYTAGNARLLNLLIGSRSPPSLDALLQKM